MSLRMVRENVLFESLNFEILSSCFTLLDSVSRGSLSWWFRGQHIYDVSGICMEPLGYPAPCNTTLLRLLVVWLVTNVFMEWVLGFCLWSSL